MPRGRKTPAAVEPNNRTAEKKALFLATLREKYSIFHAAKTAGVGRTTCYEWRADDPEFAAAWDEARADAKEVLESSAYERALAGDTTLTIFLLKGMFPEKYREKQDLNVSGEVKHAHVHVDYSAFSLDELRVLDRLTERALGAGRDQEGAR